MVKQAIQIYLRIRPNELKFPKGEYEISESNNCEKLVLKLPTDIDNNFGANNKRDNYAFKFSKIFDKESLQESVFETVAQPVIDNFLKGYNGTIFAYGQTGSGKTFTITGGAERYSDRGIIPRALTYIFNHCNKNNSGSTSIQISYLEIYNENGYDLLDTKHESAQKLEDLNKVTLFEDQDSNVNLKNLSIHPTVNEEESLNLLFIGDTNRMVAETPMNQASTRSHCIFTIHLTTQQADSAVVTRSKLHLVDLAGSERVYKTGVDGTLLTEAKYINLSLHYLEQVIVALSEKNRTHIPYRNSMMTAVLRDSLGGNCMTSMIATISIEKRNFMESISTCRFSQRVALIKNEAILNEAVDPQLIIKQLRGQIDDLRSQLQLTGESDDWASIELSEDMIRRCRNEVINYLEDNEATISKEISKDSRKINLAFETMKELYQKAKKMTLENIVSSKTESKVPTIIIPDNPIVTKEVTQLREIICQRDNEINILVSLLKKAKKDISDRNGAFTPKHNTNVTFINDNKHDVLPVESISRESKSKEYLSKEYLSKETISKESISKEYINPTESDQNIKHRILGDLSIGREEAFEIFKNNYHLNTQIETQKQDLQSKYSEAKQLGNTINNARETTNKIKAEIGRIRIQNAISADPNQLNTNVSLAMTDEEMQLRNEMEKEKIGYKDAYLKLKNLKTIIEHMQHLLETSKVKMMKEFEQWWLDEITRVENQKNNNSTKNQSLSNPKLPATTKYALIDSNRTSISSGWSKSAKSSDIPLTGDPKVDSDIQRFVEARNKLRQ